jgi:hypothetical protein
MDIVSIKQYKLGAKFYRELLKNGGVSFYKMYKYYSTKQM